MADVWPELVQQQLEQLLQRCRDQLKLDPWPHLETATHQRGHALGWVRQRHGRFVLSLSREGLQRWPETMAEEVLPHELAHVVAMMHNRHRPAHGPHWQHYCRLLGGSGRAHHQLPTTPARRSRQYLYQTSTGTEVWLGAVRHARVGKGYAYKLGGELLRFTGQWRWKPLPAQAS
jgi:predicted SprT family Zn-dependent metalloprotease